MLTQLSFNQLPQAETLRFLEQWIRVVRAAGALSDSVTAAVNDLDARTQEALAAFRKETGSEKSRLMQHLEEERDGLVSGVSNICKGQLVNPDPSFREAAEKLLANIKVYGGASQIIRLTVSAETTTVQEMLADWNKPALAAAIATLGLQGHTSRLAQANTEYDRLSVDRTSELSERDTEIDFSVKDKLTEARPFYEEAVMLINAGLAAARRSQTNVEAWTSAVNVAQAITEQYDALRTGRETRREKSAADAGNAQPA